MLVDSVLEKLRFPRSQPFEPGTTYKIIQASLRRSQPTVSILFALKLAPKAFVYAPTQRNAW